MLGLAPATLAEPCPRIPAPHPAWGSRWHPWPARGVSVSRPPGYPPPSSPSAHPRLQGQVSPRDASSPQGRGKDGAAGARLWIPPRSILPWAQGGQQWTRGQAVTLPTISRPCSLPERRQTQPSQGSATTARGGQEGWPRRGPETEDQSPEGGREGRGSCSRRRERRVQRPSWGECIVGTGCGQDAPAGQPSRACGVDTRHCPKSQGSKSLEAVTNLIYDLGRSTPAPHRILTVTAAGRGLPPCRRPATNVSPPRTGRSHCLRQAEPADGPDLGPWASGSLHICTHQPRT